MKISQYIMTRQGLEGPAQSRPGQGDCSKSEERRGEENMFRDALMITIYNHY